MARNYPRMPDKQGPLYLYFRQIGLLTTIPIVLFAGPVCGFLMGRWIDERLHTQPWGLMVFLAMGFFAAGREIVFILKKIQQQTPRT